MPAERLSNPAVAIVGATGAVGVELIHCLEQRRFPLKELRLFASARSAGRTLAFRGEALPVEELTEKSFDGIGIGLFSGVEVVDNIERNYFPMPVDATGGDDILVGRIRRDSSDATGRSISIFSAGDQLLKGAALNAVQIAEKLVS